MNHSTSWLTIAVFIGSIATSAWAADVISSAGVDGHLKNDDNEATETSEFNGLYDFRSMSSDMLSPVDPVNLETGFKPILGPTVPLPEENHGHDVKTITLTKNVPVPYPVTVEKRIPVKIEVPVDKPYPVFVPRPYEVVVEKRVPYEVKVPVPQPYTVEKHVPVPVKVHVDKPYPVHVAQPYPIFVIKKVPFTVEKQIPYPVRIPVVRPYPVHVPVEKHVPYPVEKVVPYPVHVHVDRPVPYPVEKPIPVRIEKPYPVPVEKLIPIPITVPVHIPVKVPVAIPIMSDYSQPNSNSGDGHSWASTGDVGHSQQHDHYESEETQHHKNTFRGNMKYQGEESYSNDHQDGQRESEKEQPNSDQGTPAYTWLKLHTYSQGHLDNEAGKHDEPTKHEESHSNDHHQRVPKRLLYDNQRLPAYKRPNQHNYKQGQHHQVQQDRGSQVPSHLNQGNEDVNNRHQLSSALRQRHPHIPSMNQQDEYKSLNANYDSKDGRQESYFKVNMGSLAFTNNIQHG